MVVTAMLKIVRQRLDVQFEGDQSAAFQRQVDESLNPLINGVRREYFKRLGLGDDDVEGWLSREHKASTGPLLLGDVILRDRDTVAYYRVPRAEGWLEAGVITRGEPADYNDVFDRILDIARRVTGSKDLAWTSLSPEDETASAIASEATVVVPTGKEIEAARELEQAAMHKIVSQILSAGSVFLTKFSQTLQQERAATDQAVGRFEELGMVTKDFAVLCRKTGQQILRVSSRAAIEDPSQKTFKCFICGNSVSEEVLDEIITVTDFGRKMLERDHWLVVRTLSALEGVGIPNQRVRIQAGEGNLINFFLTINDQLYLIVVANRKISLEESYLINAQVAAYRLGHVIVVSTDRVSMLMRNHLQKSNPGTEFDFIDSLHSFEDRLTAIFARKEKTVLREVLENFGHLTPVQVQDVVMQRISPALAPLAPPPVRKKAAAPAAEKPAAEPEKPTKKGKAAKEEPAPPTPETADQETPDTDFAMMSEFLDVDESMMPEAPPV